MLRLVVLDQHREAAGVDLGALAESLLRDQVRAAVQDDLSVFIGPRSRCSVEFQSKNARLKGSR